MSTLFSPLKLRELTIPNRAWMSPMCMYAADADGATAGMPTDFHLVHLASRAAGGIGLVMAEATSVRPDGRITPWDLGLWNSTQQDSFARITAAVSSHGAVPGIQLSHAGRKASVDRPWLGGAPVASAEGGWTSVGPSLEPFRGYPEPDELTVDEIEVLVGDFAESARRALAAGFKVVEVHGAHGYLINSFLSPASNHRTDSYGGSFEDRMRFPLQVIDAVRSVWPEDLPVFFRTSATDWITETNGEPGWTIEDTIRMAAVIKDHGVDLLDASTAGTSYDVKITSGPGYQVPFAARVRAETGIATAAVGKITSPEQAEQIIALGQADAVMLGRELLRNPYWANHAAKALREDARWPVEYGYAVASEW